MEKLPGKRKYLGTTREPYRCLITPEELLLILEKSKKLKLSILECINILISLTTNYSLEDLAFLVSLSLSNKSRL